jgi:hypothetical protein
MNPDRMKSSAVAMALAVGAFGCGPSYANSEGDATRTDSTFEGSSASSSGSGGVDGWPEVWYGQYYEATYVDFDGVEREIELGVEIPSSQAFHFFYNVRLEDGVVQVDAFDSTASDALTSFLTPTIEADGLVLLPEEGKDYIEWPWVPEARARAEIRPGSDCSELELEMAYTTSDQRFVTTLRRGRLCLVEPVDPTAPPPPGPQYPNYSVVVDLCIDDPPPTTCDWD